MSVLEIKELTIGYEELILLENASLSMDAGQLIGLVGQNGVGKSTLLRTLIGFHNYHQGKIEINGPFPSRYFGWKYLVLL